MQNRYFGDIHDFYKYYFLKKIARDYSLGIHWCFNKNEDQKNDGDKPLTLKEEKKDKDLYDLLKKYRHKHVKYIKPYFSKTMYYETELKDSFRDFIYEAEAIAALKNQQIIFLDPDNGIEVQSTSNKNKYKYVSFRLLVQFWNMGKSLIIYQHGSRIKGLLDKQISILYDLLNQEANIITAKKGPVTYVCVIQPTKHSFIKDELVNLRNHKEFTVVNWRGTGDII